MKDNTSVGKASFSERIERFRKTHVWQDVRLRGLSVHYYDGREPKGESGREEKTALTFLIGTVGVAELWFPYVEAFEKDWRVLLFEYPAECQDNETMIRLMKDLIDYLGIEKLVMVGSSYGGLLAQLFARAYPERTEALALFSTAVPSEASLQALKKRFGIAAAPAKGLMKSLPMGLIRPIMTRASLKQTEGLGTEEAAYLEELYRYVYRYREKKREVLMLRLLCDVMDQRAIEPEEMKFLSGRVLIVLPEEDHIFGPLLQEELAGFYEGAKVHRHMEGGHLLTRVKFSACRDLLQRFLNKNEADLLQ